MFCLSLSELEKFRGNGDEKGKISLCLSVLSAVSFSIFQHPLNSKHSVLDVSVGLLLTCLWLPLFCLTALHSSPLERESPSTLQILAHGLC